jgi:glycosyltransferase involved in cell wall biosynthesis
LLREDPLPFRRHGLSGSPWRDVFESRRLLADLASFAPDLVHVVSDGEDGAGAQLARRLRVPRVTTVHTRDVAESLAGPSPGAVIAPSQGIREALINAARVDRSRVHVVPYGLPVLWGPERAMSAQRPVVGTLGPLERGRGSEVLAEVVTTLARTRSEIVFSVVGDGPGRTAFTDRLRDLDLRQSCIVSDPCVEPRVAAQALDIAIFPSISVEATGLALLAMSVGRPVILTTIGHAFDLVDDGKTGYLVPPGDAAAVTARVLHLLDHPEEAAAMGHAARERARTRYSLDIMVRGTERVYDTVLTEAPTRLLETRGG